MENQYSGVFCVIIMLVLTYIAYEVRDKHFQIVFHNLKKNYLHIPLKDAIKKRPHIYRLSSV